jgi:hypothetical protein
VTQGVECLHEALSSNLPKERKKKIKDRMKRSGEIFANHVAYKLLISKII